ncbi:MAG: hypothetical protein HOV81_30955 [Kofleriaceae bacterium]|nr:hypothetical protein [Kofleriaceae bacterium]
MRDRQVIEREMFRAREDLEQNLAELKHAVVEKVDVKARARVALERGKEKAHDVFERGKEGAQTLAAKGVNGASDLYGRGRETVRERPVLVGSIVAGVVVAGVLLYVARRNDWI